MTADPLTPAWIASRLTEPQRQAQQRLPGDGAARTIPGEVKGEDTLRPKRDALESLIWFWLTDGIAAQLVLRSGMPSSWRATPLGLAVRAVVVREERTDA